MEVAARGSFVELVESTRHKSVLRANSSAPNFEYQNVVAPPGTRLVLSDVLARLPLLQGHFHRWRGQTRCAEFNLTIIKEGRNTRIEIPKRGTVLIDRDSASAIFDDTPFQFECETEVNFTFIGPADSNALPGATDYVSSAMLNIGSLFLTAYYPGRVQLSNLATLFALSYILGMLVRYYPAQWTALIRGQVNDAALPTLLAAVELIEEAFPRTVVDVLSPLQPRS